MYSFSSFKGFSGIWEDTIMWVHAHLPEWLTGTVAIDVPLGENGKQELKRKIEENKDKTVLLSARAQVALWGIINDQAALLDSIYEDSIDFPPGEGQRIREIVIAEQKKLDNLAKIVYQKTVNDMRNNNIPPAIEKDWVMVGFSETTAAPAAAAGGGWALSSPIGIILILVVAALAGYTIYTLITSNKKAEVLKFGLEELKRLGRPDLISQVLSGYAEEQEKSKFPWGWVIGIGSVLVGGTLILTWMSSEVRFLPSRRERSKA